MKQRMIWTLLLALAALVSTGGAAAQFGDDFDDFNDISSPIDEPPLDDLLEAPLNGDHFCWEASGVDGLLAVNDLHTRQSSSHRIRQDVDVDDDTILLAIALANNGASDIDWKKVRSFERTRTETTTASQRANLDRDDVFSALALGISDSGSSLEALSCVSDIESRAERTTRERQRVTLDEDNVLLAIALANSVGGSLDFDDIASADVSAEVEVTRDRDVDVERTDTFLALALGNGGS